MRALKISLALTGALWSVACADERTLPRTLSSFEVTLTSSVGAANRRCLLPGKLRQRCGKERTRDGREHAGAVTGFVVCIQPAAMLQVHQPGQAQLQNLR